MALMEIQASRIRARVGPGGEPVLLFEQNRSRWDRLLIDRGLAALERAERLGGAHGPYALQAAIAACHARARSADDTDWKRITELYGVLAGVAPSPVVELNRAVAVAMAFGPAAGLELVDALRSEPSLKAYHLLPSVRGDLLEKLGRYSEARLEFEQAASLTLNLRQRDLLLDRAAACNSEAPGTGLTSGHRDVDSTVRSSTSLMPSPMSRNRIPMPKAIAATPKARTDVNRDACRNDEVSAVSRRGSSRSSSA